MKLAVFSESVADESAVRVLVEAVLGRPTEPVALAGLRSRGWPAVLRTLPAVVRQLHYHRDADALVVVADSDDSPVHEPSHDLPGAQSVDCRLCQLRSTLTQVRRRLTPIPDRSSLNIACGIAIPAIEAWLLAGINVHITELAWTRGLASGKPPYSRRELKQQLYGASPVPLATETKQMVERARQLAVDLSPLITHFPIGFGTLVDELRRW